MYGAPPADNNFFIQLLWRLIKVYLHIFKSTWHILIYFCWYSDAVTSNSLQPMDCSTPGSPVHHHLPEFAQIDIHWHKFFPVSWLFVSGGQSIRASASVWVLPMNIQGIFTYIYICINMCIYLSICICIYSINGSNYYFITYDIVHLKIQYISL